MTRMTRPDCAVMCNLINTHTHTWINASGIATNNINIIASIILENVEGSKCKNNNVEIDAFVRHPNLGTTSDKPSKVVRTSPKC